MKWLVIVPALLLIAACDDTVEKTYPTCLVDDVRCNPIDAPQIEVCTENGWLATERCDLPELCRLYFENGTYATMCADIPPKNIIECHTGDIRCIYYNAFYCKEDGSLALKEDCRDSFSVCEEEFVSGHYKAFCVCENGNSTCRENDIYECKNERWVFKKSCSATTECHNTSVDHVECTEPWYDA